MMRLKFIYYSVFCWLVAFVVLLNVYPRWKNERKAQNVNNESGIKLFQLLFTRCCNVMVIFLTSETTVQKLHQP